MKVTFTCSDDLTQEQKREFANEVAKLKKDYPESDFVKVYERAKEIYKIK